MTAAAVATSARLPHFPVPQIGASLMLAYKPPLSGNSKHLVKSRKTILIIGQQRLSAVRAFSSLEAGLRVVIGQNTRESMDSEVKARIASCEIVGIDRPEVTPDQDYTEQISGGEAEARIWSWWLNSLPMELLEDILLVCVTDTICSSATSKRSLTSAHAIREACYTLRIPINVADHPELSDFTFPTTHRFPLLASDTFDSDPHSSPLQLALTTNANSCRLAARIRREVVTRLPKGVGSAVAKIGQLRESARRVDEIAQFPDEGEREEGWSSTLLNTPVSQIPQPHSRSRCTSPIRAKHALSSAFSANHFPLTPPSTPPTDSPQGDELRDILAHAAVPVSLNSATRMRFIAQISEYWPIDRLATMSDVEAASIISLYSKTPPPNCTQDLPSAVPPQPPSMIYSSDHLPTQGSGHRVSCAASEAELLPRHQIAFNAPMATLQKRGRIFLLGSGPGSPALLTMAAYSLLTQHATLILSDKLVPPQIIALIPKHIPLTIAKKFPGNAEGAQNELMDLAYEAAERGETVVRLKQGDPYVYGRGGEEVLFFRERGFEAVVVPGISSAFAAPLMAGIPVTQRGVSESVVICTGVGRKGKGVKLPGYERARTTVVLMGVARLPGVIQALTSIEGQERHGREGGARDGVAYPPYCPIAIIERGSSPDQRLVASSLEGIVEAMGRAGDQRPPGMMVIGWSVLALDGKGDVEVLDSISDLSPQELENADRARVLGWLGPKGLIVREGLAPNWFELFDRGEGRLHNAGLVESPT